MARPRSPKQTHIGPLGPGSKTAKHYIPDRVDFSDMPARITNAGSRKPLVLSDEWASAKRPGSEVAFSLPSKGTRC